MENIATVALMSWQSSNEQTTLLIKSPKWYNCSISYKRSTNKLKKKDTSVQKIYRTT
jgi:hypothetical protein